MRAFKQMFLILNFMLFILLTIKPTRVFAQSDIQFTTQEKEFISRTQNKQPLKVGIIPHTFPLSECPPATSDYVGTNVEMLSLISQKTGLKFEYGRIPLETMTPYEALLAKEFSFVAGTIKLDTFKKNPNLLLSDRLDDGSAICICKREVNPDILYKGNVAVLKGYQAGTEFSQKHFPALNIIYFESNQEVIDAVRKGTADLAIISRYVGIYELQSPLNEKLNILSPYQIEIDSCVMGENTSDNQLAISIINKGLAQISESEYNHVQMNFSISHPYKLSTFEVLYKFRFIFSIGIMAVIILSILTLKLVSSQKERKLLSRDSLTGGLTEAGFELVISKMLAKANKSLYIIDFDLSNFSTYNELHGKPQGDELLKAIAKIVCTYLSDQDVICRSYADNFKVLVSKESIDDLIDDIKQANIRFNEMVDSKMVFNFGIYAITDPDLPITKMLDFAAIARKNVKSKSDSFIGIFNAQLYSQHLKNVELLESFDSAIQNEEFVAYYQPKFDTITQKLIGAEALVRWITKTGEFIMPSLFIELFEKNGQIQRLDFYMLEQVCKLLKRLIESGKPVVPISVNFSRVHLFSNDFIKTILEMTESYHIPKHYIEIECTETAITYDSDLSIEILGKLRKLGFEIAMDDFGKGYSSLSALSSMPLDIIKLDGGFLYDSIGQEKDKSDKIITSVISLIHELSLKVIAEGVETEEQYLFLKDIGCEYIQGYYFSRPLKEDAFLEKLYTLS